ncbi:SPRY domain-containing protein 3-like [Takifugu rubripes]|uniref:SPRY domain containing 3 n=2 Tax=Takifugu TaxID=31032 RepID=H2VDZ5_TAKRU|nr:SPRY domain-containing protein 3-like [Takifugu rubripes]XP_056886866.1 SPRY domain-containing protein 3-like isoform X1 [Takifugu flavidus]XP_056886867.1 SPRY domain-containing protein 3-like isoform X1 [Takifugu flavidus]|eukprot:XP_003973187.1 PREDICTED: SPRY domain-containing protein 3-like [Takifugu rubripes]
MGDENHYRMRIREIRQARRARWRGQLSRILRDGDVLRYHGNSDEVGCFVAARPFSRGNRYFEVTIIDTGVRGMIAVGLVPKLYDLDQQPGWLQHSVGFHADDGKLYNGNTVGQQFGPKCCRGDKIGCGISPDSDDGQVTVFFTKNGKEVGSVEIAASLDTLYPAVGMHSLGEEVLLDLNAEWGTDEDDGQMIVDSHEDDWSCLHDVRLTGTLLKYVGKGKSIVDVGLAQARRPLNTRFHYYELEITDAGEKCYIALGLARRDYPKNRHPGWSRGSIAYHADDGKLFHGSGVGDPFGPRCFEGDVMGCGIMFPRDFTDDETDDWGFEVFTKPSEVQNDLYAGQEEEESEGEDLEGKKVVVFFTRNGKLVGRREVALPVGGLYPTIGMMSSGEKVRVDLHPLSG